MFGWQPKALSTFSSQHKQVQFIGKAKRHQKSEQNNPESGSESAHRQIFYSADAKVRITIQGIREKGKYGVNSCAENTGHGHPCQNQCYPGGPGPFRDQQNKKRTEQGPTKGGQRDREPQGRHKSAAQSYCQPSSGIDAYNVGGGQGIAQNSLDNNTRCG